MKFLDTDIFIDFLRGVDKAQQFIEEFYHEILYSAVTETELLSGSECLDIAKRKKLLDLLSQFHKIPLDNPAAQIAGDIRRDLKIGTPDAMIAASCLKLNATLITRNLKDYNKVKGLDVIKPY